MGICVRRQRVWQFLGATAMAALAAGVLRTRAGEVALESPVPAPKAAGAEQPKTPESIAKDEVSATEEVIVVAGMPTPGRPVLPADETQFSFKLSATGDVITLRWVDLPEEERQRVQRICGLQIEGERRRIGEKVTGYRYVLQSGKSIIGLPIPERDRPGRAAIRTASSPLLELVESDIRSRQPTECYEGDFYSLAELYARQLLKKRLSEKDAAGHVAMAQWAAGVGLYSKALDHLAMAAVIDPRMKEHNREFEAQVVAGERKQRADCIYTSMVIAKNGRDFVTASRLLDTLKRNFQDSDLRSRWEGLSKEIEDGVRAITAEKVVHVSYTMAGELIQEKMRVKVGVDGNNNLVPVVPGKQVTTRHGHVFRGVPESGGGGADMVLQCEKLKVTIAAKDIVNVQDIDLSVPTRLVNPAYDELRDFVIDTKRPDGLKAQMIARISQQLKVAEATVKEIFEGRAVREAIYKDGVLTANRCYAFSHDVSYGIGSWLREGAKPVPLTEDQRKLYANRNWNGLAIRNNAVPSKKLDPNEDPELTDDPAVWWKYQTPNVQYAVLLAMAGEKVFSGKVRKRECAHCDGGQIQVTTDTDKVEKYRCAPCRGMGVRFDVTYE